MTKRTTYTILLLLILIGTGLRAYKLTYWSLWNDEGHTFDCVRIPLYSPDSTEPMAKNYPLNFLITQVFCHYFGLTELGGRLFPCLMGILAIPLVFFFTRRIFDDRTALLTTAIIAFSSWHIEWSQNARHYTPLFVLMICSAGWFHLGLERNRWPYLILSMVAVGLSILMHPSGAFVVPGFFLYAGSLFLLKDWKRPLGFTTKNLLIFWSPFVAGFIVISPKFIKLVDYLLHGKHPWNPVTNVMGGVAFYLGVPLLLFSLAAFIVLLHERDRRGLYLFCLCVAQAVSLIVVARLTVASNVYNLFALWPLAMVVSWLGLRVAESLPRPTRMVGYAIPGLIVLLHIQSTAFYFTTQHGNRYPYRPAIEFVRAQKDFSGDDILYVSSGSVGEFYFNYRQAPDTPYDIRWLDSSGFNEDQFLKENRPAWCVYSASVYDPYPEIDNFLKEKCRFLKDFTVNTGIKVRTLQVYRYDAVRP